MNTSLQIGTETMSKLALAGDVGGLNPQEKIKYYAALCERVGLDPATQPFKLMRLSGKEVFYLDRSGAQQLNRLHQISHEIKTREFANGCYVVTARASIGNRFTDSIGAVACEGLKGEALANATMKAETKAKRRATLDLVGLGMLDETEVETIPAAERISAAPVPMPQKQIEGGFEAVKPARTEIVATTTAIRNKNAPEATQERPRAIQERSVTANGAHKDATAVTRGAMMEWLMAQGATEQDILGYAIDKAICLPNEGLVDWPLDKVGTSKQAWCDLAKEIVRWKDGDLAMPVKNPDDETGMTGGAQGASHIKDPLAESLKRIEAVTVPDAPDPNRVVGLVQTVSEKSGIGKNKKPYTKFGVKLNDVWFDTFDSTIAATCRQAKEYNDKVDIEFQEKMWAAGKTNKEILSCVVVELEADLIP